MGLFSKLFGKKNKKEEVLPKNDANEPVKKVDVAEQNEKSEIAKQSKACKPKDTAPAEPAQIKSSQKKETPANVKKQETVAVESKDEIKHEECESIVDAPKKAQVGFFEIKKSKDDRYVFNLYAANKVIVATSQIYSSSQSAQNGIKSVIANAEKAAVEDQTLVKFTPQPFPKWEIYKDKAGQFRFRLSASNGSCICHSQGYTTKSSCKNGIESIIRTVKDAKINKSYIKN